MEVKRLMKHQVRVCRPQDSLNDAAQIMWEEAGLSPGKGALGL